MIGHTAPYNKPTHMPVKLCWGGPMKKADGGLANAAQHVANAGQFGDSMIIHVNPREFEQMKGMFGEPKVNPHTGMPSFFDFGDFISGALGYGGDSTAADTASAAADIPDVSTSAGDAEIPTDTSPSVGSLPYFAQGTAPSLSFLDSAASPAATATAAADTASAAPQGGLSSILGGLLGKGSTKDGGGLNSLLKMAMIGQFLYGMMGGRNKGAPPPKMVNNTGFNSHLPNLSMPRTLANPNINYANYGINGGQSFFNNNQLPTMNYARGGLSHAARPVANPATRYVQGPGTGRSDDIPARLSNNEYVMDAESVAMLGDGSPDAGAKKLDEFRANIRKHKGAALARGEISPDAKAPEQYLKGGLSRVKHN